MNRLLFAPAIAALLLAMAIARGDIVQPPQLAPVDRLLKSAQTWLAAHPAEGDAHYTLARIHYLAFVRGAQSVPAFADGPGGKPSVASDWSMAFELYEARQKRAEELALKDIGERGAKPSAEKASAFEEARGKRARQLEEQDWQPCGDLPAADKVAHAAAALAEFREAIRLEPKNALYVFGLASLNERFAQWAAAQKPAGIPPELRALSASAARDGYFAAFRLAIARDAARTTMPPEGIASLVSHEAGAAYLRLAERDRAKLKPSIEEVKGALKKLKKLRVDTAA